MANKYYGGGYKGSNIGDATALNGGSILSRGATWPFYRLTLTEHGVALRTPWQVISKNFHEIKSVSLELPATLKFQFMDPKCDFGFIYANPKKIIHELNSYGVAVHRAEQARVKMARLFCLLLISTALIILCVILAGTLGAFD